MSAFKLPKRIKQKINNYLFHPKDIELIGPKMYI